MSPSHRLCTLAAELTLSHRIPKGTILIGNTWGLHHDPNKFPEPNVFRPERYADSPLSAPEYAALGGDDARDHYGYGWSVAVPNSVVRQNVQIGRASCRERVS